MTPCGNPVLCKECTEPNRCILDLGHNYRCIPKRHSCHEGLI